MRLLRGLRPSRLQDDSEQDKVEEVSKASIKAGTKASTIHDPIELSSDAESLLSLRTTLDSAAEPASADGPASSAPVAN